MMTKAQIRKEALKRIIRYNIRSIYWNYPPSTLTRTTSSADSSSPRSSMQTAMAYLVGCSDIGSGDATGGSHGNTTA